MQGEGGKAAAEEENGTEQHWQGCRQEQADLGKPCSTGLRHE